MPNKATLSPKEASQYVGLSYSTLQRLRNSGVGPRYIKLTGTGKNTKVLYPIAELDRFIQNNLQATM
ncbi:MAG: hypothetical protein KU29_07455 [Sulfurovum sp. FS06-10]|nr:MAG: hypothetical protein KU29_07455 [Sulfurovum sp. FS06-10]